MDKAQDAMGGVVDKAQEAMGSAAHSARQAVGGAVDTARDAGSGVMGIIESNPLPAALLATSVGWLWMNHRRQAEEWRYSGRRDTNDNLRGYGDPWRQYDAPGAAAPAPGASAVTEALRGAQDRVGEVAGQVHDKAGQLLDQTQERVSQLGSSAAQQAERTADLFQRTLHQNPIAAGAVVFGLGAALGLLLPETRQENQWMGQARDQVLHKAQETVQDVGMKAQIVAEEAFGAAKQEAKAQGLTPDPERAA